MDGRLHAPKRIHALLYIGRLFVLLDVSQHNSPKQTEETALKSERMGVQGFLTVQTGRPLDRVCKWLQTASGGALKSSC